jgi:hypothetical protein
MKSVILIPLLAFFLSADGYSQIKGVEQEEYLPYLTGNSVLLSGGLPTGKFLVSPIPTTRIQTVIW